MVNVHFHTGVLRSFLLSKVKINVYNAILIFLQSMSKYNTHENLSFLKVYSFENVP